MWISLTWLQQLVNVKTTDLEHLLEKLTLGGFEVEELLELKIDKKKEILIEISATANRADSLSIKGIAKELISLININKKEACYLTENLDFKTKVQELFSPKNLFLDCSLFYAITIENLVNFNSPYWLKQKLFSVGILPLNNLLDYQNYILIETGYPFEFYDLEKIKEKSQTSKLNLTLEFLHNNKKFIGNNNVQYKLTDKVSVLKSNNNILSIAGILPNKEFSYKKPTNSLLIEGAVYNPQKIRKISRFYNLRTERSIRYEKGLSNSDFIESFYRLIFLLKILNPNLICKLVTSYKETEKIVQPIQLKYENIIKTLGSIKQINNRQTNQICISQISNYLNRLNCKFNFNNETLIWQVTIPKIRSEDISREIDLIEEIGRFYGFNNFRICLPKINRIGWKDFSYEIRKKMINCFLNEGFNELINYSFVKETNKNSIQLLNPLLIDSKNLRNSLLPNILQMISYNNKQMNSNIEGFEFGHIFFKENNIVYKEFEFIAGIFGGIPFKTVWSENSNTLSWFEAKGKIQEIFSKVNLLVNWKNLNKNIYESIIHPNRGANLYLNNNIDIGIFGQIHPILAQELNISSQLFLFEFNFEFIKNEIKRIKLSFFKYYYLYPKIYKDISFIINQNFSFEMIKTTILLYGLPYLIQINLLDAYQGKLIPISYTSLCIQFVFQSDQKTLITKEIDEIIFTIKSILIKKFQAKIRL